MAESNVSIGRVKREISELVNRVAFGGERIVLTSRGKPKAVIISLDDYERIQQSDREKQLNQWETWQIKNESLTERILTEWGGERLDADAIWAETRTDLERRHDELFDN